MLIKIYDDNFTVDKVGRKAYNLGLLTKAGIQTLEGVSLIQPITDNDIENAWNFFSGEKYLAVRSSMLDEDGVLVSMAGKFDTVLGVKTYSDFKSAVHRVLNSNNNSMNSAIFVQRMLDSHISGVLFTRTEANGDYMFIETTYGLGETLVGGMITPDQYLVNRTSVEVFETVSTKKIFGIFLEKMELSIGDFLECSFGNVRKVGNIGKGKFLGSISYFNRKNASITNEMINELVEVGKKIEELFECPQDIEFGFSNGELKILQSRPITSFLHLTPNSNNSNDDYELTGITASNGEVQGVVRTSFTPGEIITEPFIYVGFELNPELIYRLDKVLGIVTESGGILCHASIVARELKIPCLVGVKDITSKLKQGDKIILNATKGFVERGEIIDSK